MEKTCFKCGKTKPIEAFEKRKDVSSGYGGTCKECRKRPELKEYRVKYYVEHKVIKPKVKVICVRCGKEFETYHAKHCSDDCKHPKKALSRQLRLLTEEEKKRVYNERHIAKYGIDNIRARRKESAKKYKQEHLLEYRAKRQAYKVNRMQNDIGYRLKVLISNKVRQTINGDKQYKHSIDLLGCSVADVRSHLERQFKDGMTWDNWGVTGWHIDHIIPVSSFDFTKKEDQYRCFHYTNLQPLWYDENIRKSNKILTKQLQLM